MKSRDANVNGMANSRRPSGLMRYLIEGAVVVVAPLLGIACDAPSATIVPTAPPATMVPTFIPTLTHMPATVPAEVTGPCAGTRLVASAPADAAQAEAFSSFGHYVRYPYQNVRIGTTSSDGSFARVVLCAELRRSADQDWQDYSGEYELTRISGRWDISHDPLLSVMGGFETVRAQATLQAVDKARAAAEQAAAEAKKTLHFSIVKCVRHIQQPALLEHHLRGPVGRRSAAIA
jgi:hypothetical protein